MLREFNSAYDSAAQLVIFLIKYLIHRSCLSDYSSKIDTSKTKIGSNEAEYRHILETLFKDLITVMGSPDWPVADLFALKGSLVMVKSILKNISNNTGRLNF